MLLSDINSGTKSLFNTMLSANLKSREFPDLHLFIFFLPHYTHTHTHTHTHTPQYSIDSGNIHMKCLRSDTSKEEI